MNVDCTVLAQPPGSFGEAEIQDFLAMVRAGGEVGGQVLEKNVRHAQCLAVARQASCLVGVAALKNPLESYRKSIASKAGAALSGQDFPFELGYIFVLPSARRQGVSRKLCDAALAAADANGVFATARTNNCGMNAILPKLGFSKIGSPYGSDRGGHQLQLFVLRTAQPAFATDAPQGPNP